MKSDDVEKMLENMKKPEVEVTSPREIKLAILNYKKSAWLTIWLVVLPIIFVLSMIMKYSFGIDLGILLTIGEWVASFDDVAGLKWLGPLLLVGLPMLGIALNALAITHVSYQSLTKSIQVTVRLRWLNISILLVSLVIIGIIFLYALGENCN
jgi:hypothetical protein